MSSSADCFAAKLCRLVFWILACASVRGALRIGREIRSIASSELSAVCDPDRLKLATGSQVENYIVDECLGIGSFGEVWTLKGSDQVLKYAWEGLDRSECSFGHIASAKDPIHFVDCVAEGKGYSIWQRVAGVELGTLTHEQSEGWEKILIEAIPDLHSVLSHLVEIFEMFDALQTAIESGPGIGLRQWHTDAHSGNLLVSKDSFKLIDYGDTYTCCEDGFACPDIFPGSKGWQTFALSLSERAREDGKPDSWAMSFIAPPAGLFPLASNLTARELQSLPTDYPNLLEKALDVVELGNWTKDDARDFFVGAWGDLAALAFGPKCTNEKVNQMNFANTKRLWWLFCELLLPTSYEQEAKNMMFSSIFSSEAPLTEILSYLKHHARQNYKAGLSSQFDGIVHAMVDELRQDEHEWPPRFMSKVRAAS